MSDGSSLRGYGMEALHRLYVRTNTRRADFLPDHLQQWWAKVAGFEKKWIYFIFSLLGFAVVALFIFNAEQSALVRYMEDQAVDPAEAIKMAWLQLHTCDLVCGVFGAVSGGDCLHCQRRVGGQGRKMGLDHSGLDYGHRPCAGG